MDANNVVNLNSLLKRLNGSLAAKSEIASEQREIRNIEAIFRGVEKALSEVFADESSLMLVTINHTTQIAREFELSEEAIQRWIMLRSANLWPSLN